MSPERPRKSEFDEWYDNLTDEQRHEVNEHLRTIVKGMGVNVQYKKLLAFYEETFVAQEDLFDISARVSAKVSLN